MRETAEDLEQLQRLIDASYAAAGSHLLEIHTPDRRLSAVELVERLPGMRVLVLATVTSDGRPLVSPVDGFFYRGTFWFGTSSTSVRARHLARNSFVSASHVVGESLAVTMHGSAEPVDMESEHDFVEVCREIYGEGWDEFARGAPYYRIEPTRLFTFAMDHPPG